MQFNLVIDQNRGNLFKVDLASFNHFVREVITISAVPLGVKRGGHAHKLTHQTLVLICGQVQIDAVYRQNSVSKILSRPGEYFHLPPLTWGEQTYLSEETVLQVYSSLQYSENDYIDNLEKLKILWQENE